MPLYYDTVYASTTSGSAGTEVTQLWVKTAANQETLSIVGLYGSARGGTAGGATLRAKTNTGTTASGGSAQASTARTCAMPCLRRGLAQRAPPSPSVPPRQPHRGRRGATGGQGGHPDHPAGGVQMMPNATNPIDLEITSLANGSSIPIDITVEFGEGI
jgi:hypothetical protein